MTTTTTPALMGSKKNYAVYATLISGVFLALGLPAIPEDQLAPLIEGLQYFFGLVTGGYVVVQTSGDLMGYAKSAIHSRKFWITMTATLSSPAAILISLQYGVPIEKLVVCLKAAGWMVAGVNTGFGAGDLVTLFRDNKKPQVAR